MLHYLYRFLLIGCWAITASAQDIHFTQNYSTPLAVNPAMTGLFNGDARFNAIYRNQWSSVMQSPYKTLAVSGDAKLLPSGSGGDNWLSGGLSFFSDRAGAVSLSTYLLDASLAYNLMLDEGHHVSVGLSGGAAQQSFDEQAAQFGSQYDGSFNGNMASGEVFDRTAVWYMNVGAGLMYYYAPAARNYWYGGMAVYHANSPSANFFEESREKIAQKLVFQVGGSIPVARYIDIVPNVYFFYQSPERMVDVGTQVRYILQTFSQTGTFNAVSIGAGARVNGGGAGSYAIWASAAVDVNRFTVGLSYDFNISPLNIASNGRGAMEISVAYLAGFRPPRRAGSPINCPRF